MNLTAPHEKDGFLLRAQNAEEANWIGKLTGRELRAVSIDDITVRIAPAPTTTARKKNGNPKR